MSSKTITLMGCSLLFAVGIAGCGQSVPTLAEYNNTNIKKLRGAYGMYLVSHNMRGPENEEVFKEYLTTNPGAISKMELMGVSKDRILDVFVSERDGQPFKIRYGLIGLGDHPIVFEAVGVDGKRFVAFSPPRELGKEEYERYWNSKTIRNLGTEEMEEAL